MGGDGMAWNEMGWRGVGWDVMAWHSVDGMAWHRMAWHGVMGWDGMELDGMGWHHMGQQWPQERHRSRSFPPHPHPPQQQPLLHAAARGFSKGWHKGEFLAVGWS